MAGAVDKAQETLGAAEVEAVAQLARIALREGEAAALARDLGRFLAEAQTLMALDLDGVDPSYSVSADGPAASGAVDAAPPGAGPARLRADEPAHSLDRTDALRAAPEQDGVFFVVPTVVERT